MVRKCKRRGKRGKGKQRQRPERWASPERVRQLAHDVRRRAAEVVEIADWLANLDADSLVALRRRAESGEVGDVSAGTSLIAQAANLGPAVTRLADGPLKELVEAFVFAWPVAAINLVFEDLVEGVSTDA